MHADLATIRRDAEFQGTGTPPTAIALSALHSLGTALSLERCRQIHTEGDPANYWYKLVSGTACTYRLLADGRRHIESFHLAGDIFGISGGPAHRASADALSDCVVVRYARSAVERLIESDPAFARAVRGMTFGRLDAIHSQLLMLGRKTASERLASFLIEMSERLDDEGCVTLPMSRSDIGDYLGITIETVSRTFSQLRRDGLIALPSPNMVRLIDREALLDLADGQCSLDRKLSDLCDRRDGRSRTLSFDLTLTKTARYC